eukprot:gnl/Dysnectes_brevis/3291_a4129_1153.p1 GENE.gnl/Dysnectes_brevis/3291_a4129_1153~~gnl/Dysnectes_brevis/3291_a4129_1153.p1  ORF type:complete len:316 (+),score=41.35 gnl/Dysnectes_brevis/3291_a4129_1153:56-1003(+)
MQQIVTIGSYNQDLVWNVPRFSTPGETIAATGFSTFHGGKGFNQAQTVFKLSKNPLQTLFIGAVGTDIAGDAAILHIESQQMPHQIVRKDSRPTGNAAIMVDSSGENQIIISSGANGVLCDSDIPLSVIKQASMFLLQGENGPQETLAILKRINEHRAPDAVVVFNCAPFRPEFEWATLLPLIDFLVANQTEIDLLRSTLQLGDCPAPGLVGRLGLSGLLLTLGADGVGYTTGDAMVTVPAMAVSHVVDTTGAGDSFLGAFCVRFTECSGDLESRMAEACRFGCVTAGLKVQRVGASSIPTRNEALSALAEESHK